MLIISVKIVRERYNYNNSSKLETIFKPRYVFDPDFKLCIHRDNDNEKIIIDHSAFASINFLNLIHNNTLSHSIRNYFTHRITPEIDLSRILTRITGRR